MSAGQEVEAAQPLPTVLARYTSLLDETRPGIASPASFSREDHRGALLTLQRGLERMSGQRKAEEEHMACTTRVKPAKHPRGGYMYVDIDTGEWQAMSLNEMHGCGDIAQWNARDVAVARCMRCCVGASFHAGARVALRCGDGMSGGMSAARRKGLDSDLL
jgi:hypothetical protein